MAKHNAKQATVELLTAEVRVLMVGSRQVTMSVFNQLDVVHPDCVEPFGRVNFGEGSFLWGVGKRKFDSSLVRFHYDLFNLSLCEDDEEIELTKDDNDDIRNGWEEMPLIVLAGLR